MNKQIITAAKFIVAASLAASLAACGSSKPSESEAKAVVKNAIDGCSYLSLENFDKTNGEPIDENHYRVDVKYTLKLKPDSDSKDMLEKWADVAKEYRETLAKEEKLANDEAGERIAKEEAERDSPTPMTNEQIADESAQKPVDPEIMELDGKMDDLRGQMNRLGGPMGYAQTVLSACPRLSRQLVGQFFGKGVTADDLEDGVSMEFSESYQMQRSDDGWIAAE